MKRLGGWLALLVVLAVGAWGARVYAARYAVALERARVAQAFADSVAGEAAKRDAEAAKAREAIAVATEARKAAQRAASATQRAMHSLLDSVEVAAADSAVARDSLVRLIGSLASRIRADSAARAEADSLADVERLRAGFAVAAQVRATDDWRRAYEAEVKAHAKTKAIGRRGFLANLASLACTVAITGASAEVGGKVYPEGGAAIGGAGGYLASRAVCR